MAVLWIKGDIQYPVLIEPQLYKTCGRRLADIIPPGKILLVSDSQVFPLYGQEVKNALAEAGFNVCSLVLQPGENTKSWQSAELIYAAALEAGMEREGAVFAALGGGVIGDLAGFAAATYLRGIPFIQFPTSLLAQVDSSVGGKVAINITRGKNLIGAFYNPIAVVLDTGVLSTLSRRDLISGLGEIIKYGIIGDRELFTILEKKMSDILQGQIDCWDEIVIKCLKVKADVVAADPRERDLRRILNFGHTLGHALEREAGYGYYRHGEAVALGMEMAVSIALKADLLREDNAVRMQELIGKLPLPLFPKHITADNLLNAVASDKKRKQGRTVWVLPADIGQVELRNDIDDDLVRSILKKYCRQ